MAAGPVLLRALGGVTWVPHVLRGGDFPAAAAEIRGMSPWRMDKESGAMGEDNLGSWSFLKERGVFWASAISKR